jgi:serine protease Do
VGDEVADDVGQDVGVGVARRTERRAILLAVAAVALSIGVILGAALHGSSRVNAGRHVVPVELSSAFVEISRQVEPSVVNISTVSQPSMKAGRSRESLEPRSPLDLLPFSRERGARRGNGSGVIVDVKGYILTNRHVIEGADRIRVKLHNGQELIATVVGSDAETDLAVLKVESQAQLEAARMGDSDQTRVGDWVLAIGSPFGLDETVTAGIVSARDREATELSSESRYQHFLQTDAAINRGNSGGPLINLAGEVIGINTAIATSTGDYNGIGFALPASEAIVVYQQLVKSGRVVRGFLGVYTDRVTPQIARIFSLPAPRGAIITQVSDRFEVDGRQTPTPAAAAGLRANDVIIEFNGASVKDELDLIRRVAASAVGQTVSMTYYREGEAHSTTVTIARRNGEEAESRAASAGSGDKSNNKDKNTLGLNLANQTAPAARRLQTAQSAERRGVIVLSVDSGSVADDVDVRRNDLIEKINRESVASVDEFCRALDKVKKGDAVVLQVYRQTQTPSRRFISLDKP